MNKATALQLIIAYAEVTNALNRIRKRQNKIRDKEFNEYPDAFNDFRYFGDKLEEARNDIQHRVLYAQEIIDGINNED